MELAYQISSAIDKLSMPSTKEPLLSSLSKPVRLALYYFMSVIALSIVGGFGVNYELWGYWYKRPGILDEAKTIEKIERYVLVRTSDCRKPKECSFIVDPDLRLSDILNYSSDKDLYKRLQSYLQSKGVLPTFSDRDLKGVPDLYTAMVKTPIVVTPSKNFSHHKISGIILIGKTSFGEKRAFISAIGSQISDGYIPYYEAIFKIGANNQSVQYLEGQRFFFDTEMDEGFLTVAVVFIMILMFGGIPTVIAIIIDDILSQRKKLFMK
ncbi:hypothetical protein [Acaryochloris marina]|uniref:Uncharacterized protein n=1 Tax=Acaryochloris marina (strain MBIC 11017) TaxID=329726 RepID=A8ZQC9_ACAM1|nr:hypothetical protein [Acaryochloris marina]ABW33215.1 hypothetical protein AM1_G0035 [Acaryochloris marina MBIC11017]